MTTFSMYLREISFAQLCQNSLNGMLKFVHVPVCRFPSKRGKGVGRGEGKRGQEKEDNHKIQTKLVNTIQIEVFRMELNEPALSSIMCMDFKKM